MYERKFWEKWEQRKKESDEKQLKELPGKEFEVFGETFAVVEVGIDNGFVSIFDDSSIVPVRFTDGSFAFVARRNDDYWVWISTNEELRGAIMNSLEMPKAEDGNDVVWISGRDKSGYFRGGFFYNSKSGILDHFWRAKS